MNPNDTPNQTETTTPPTQPLPDAERRGLLKRLGAAAVVVPAATVLHDATRNIAQAAS